MKRLVLAFVVAVISFTGIAAQEHKERTAPAPTEPQPSRYFSDEGRYSIMFPSQPKLSTQNMTDPNGQSYVQYMAMASDANMFLMVGYFDYGSGIIFSLDKARDGMVESVSGTLVDEHSVSLGGAPGRQVKIAGTTQGIDFIDHARFYDVNGRVYVLQCMVQKTADGSASAERCEQFFDSFKVRAMP